MKIQLSDHFNYYRMFRFTLPTIVMMVFSSLYVIVDGLFVSNIVGSDALASINIIYPAIMVIGAFGFMLGMGGNAEVAKTLGEGRTKEARQYFTMIVLAIFLLGTFLTVISIIFIRPISYFLGASDRLIEYCVDYGRVILFGGILFMLQVSFQSFFITAERPTYAMAFSLAAGFTNMILDYVFIVVLHMGIVGAAWATTCGYAVGGVIPLFYFIAPNKSLLRFTKPAFDFKVLLHSAVNGSSEMVANLSSSLTTWLYNFQMMRLAGEDGVAAITVILYLIFVFNAIVMGFSFGISPVIGFHYGADNRAELQNLFRRCLRVTAAVSVTMVLLAQITAAPVTDIFCGDNENLREMTTYGMHIYSTAFLLCGFNIFGSSLFTALCNGKISAAISFTRTLVMEAGMLLLLPFLIGITGVWLAVPIAEAVTLVAVIYFIIRYRDRYGYY